MTAYLVVLFEGAVEVSHSRLVEAKLTYVALESVATVCIQCHTLADSLVLHACAQQKKRINPHM